MNYAIFNIEEKISNLLKNQSNKELYNTILQEIINKKNSCRELIKSQEDKQFRNNRVFSDTALLLQYLIESERYIENIKNKISNDKNDVLLMIFQKLVKYQLMVFKEIYLMSINDCFLGAVGRYRIFLELYCILKYFINFPNAISRFIDHYLLRDYLFNKRINPLKITNDDINCYKLLRNRYKSEYKIFIKNYGWTCHKLNEPNSIKELFKLTFNENECSFISTEYNNVSEYSHASLSIAMKNKINTLELYNFLGKSGTLSIVIIKIYIGWIMNVTKMEDKRLTTLLNILDNLEKIIYTDYHVKNNPKVV